MRKALFKCIGTGKIIYFEEINSRTLRYLYGYNKELSNAQQILPWLEDNGVEHTKRFDFEMQFDAYKGSLMVCLLHRD